MEQRAVSPSKPIPWLRRALLCLFVLQPLLDILSYWSVPLGIPDAVSIALRAAVMLGFGVVGFALSRHRRYYLLALAAGLALLVGHVIACTQAGYVDVRSDLINLMRVAQLPLFTFCMITCLRRDRYCARTLEQGLMVNYWIITLSVLLSIVTHTAASTYDESGFGVIGWFATTNAQSSILSMLAPIVLILQYRKRVYPLFCLTAVTVYAQLYFVGTRLAFATIAVTFLGLVLTAFITRNVNRKYLLTLALLGAVCFGCIRLSPMVRHQTEYSASMSAKQDDSARMLREGTTLPQDFTPVDPEDVKAQAQDPDALELIYGFYAKGLCDRFGVERVMERYHYTSDVAAITATRQQKIVYCEMLLEELPPLSKWFGIELSRMTYDGFNYDAENDFHGIYFLYGRVGLALMLVFLGYFVFRIAAALVRDFRRCFTLEAGAFGMAFLLAMVYAYHTAGLLRRPNASFYLSVILAYIYYLVQLRPKGNEG